MASRKFVLIRAPYLALPHALKKLNCIVAISLLANENRPPSYFTFLNDSSHHRAHALMDRSMIIRSYNNKVAFITGGASGIGLGMAQAFAEKGMKLALADMDAATLLTQQQAFKAAGHEVLCFTLDICNRDALRAAAKQIVEHFGALHVVCANAGVAGNIGPLQNGTDSDWDWIIDINLKGTVNTVQACLPYLLKNPAESHIVLTSSISGLRVYDPSRGQGMYNTTKFAMVGFGEALKVDLQAQGVGVSILCPGVVNTNISHSGLKRPARYGGPVEVPDDFVLAKASKFGTDPLQFGRWVLKGMERNQLYIITHPDDRALVEQRHARVMAGFDSCAEITKP
jgi:NAD(P)-dependent dehydrogenase (short-subunit alcohol dehydrogenase family)